LAVDAFDEEADLEVEHLAHPRGDGPRQVDPMERVAEGRSAGKAA
jgi:hypothetical protein